MARGPLLLLALLLAPACIVTPPALLESKGLELAKAREHYPDGTEVVVVDIGRGHGLRGFYVPSDPGAPVVLHLLESGASAAAVQLPHEELASQLCDLGFASLVLDYQGVGASDGGRSADHIEGDGLAMWAEAVRRAGGDEGRVVLRATSIGGVAMSAILESGAKPAAAIWIAPVHPKSVTRHYADFVYGRVGGWIAGFLFRRVGSVDVEAMLATAPCPVLAFAAMQDELLREDDARALRKATLEGGGRWLTIEGDHAQGTLTGRAIAPEEIDLFQERLPDTPPAEERARTVLASAPEEIQEKFADGTEEREKLIAMCRLLDAREPQRVVVASLANEDPLDTARLVWAGLDRKLADLPIEEAAEALSLEDPSGKLALEAVIETAAAGSIGSPRSNFMVRVQDSKAIAERVRRIDDATMPRENSITVGLQNGFRIVRSSNLAGLWRSLRIHGLSVADARRQVARTLLKANSVPDRVRTAIDGSVRLQAYEDGRWIELDLSDPAEDE